MKVRQTRCHQTGNSNRFDMMSTERSMNNQQRASSMVETAAPSKLAQTTQNTLSKTAAATAAFKTTVNSITKNKSQSLASKSKFDGLQQSNVFTLQNRNIESVYDGSDMELNSRRFDTDEFRKNQAALTFNRKMEIPRLYEPIGSTLNKEIKHIRQHFQHKDINMHKLRQIKLAFLKNFQQKHQVSQIFSQFAEAGKINRAGFKRFVKGFGFDINDDEIKLMLSLTNNKVAQEVEATIEDFINLTSKPNIYFDTLKVKDHKTLTEKPRHFSKKVHLILRNSFIRLKQAMRIYDKQCMKLTQEEFRRVFKKLDLTELVITNQQIKDIFENFKQSDGSLNSEKLLGAIAEQQNQNVLMKKRPVEVEFQDHVARHAEIKANFNSQYVKHIEHLKSLSNNDYQRYLKRIRQMMTSIKKRFPDKKHLQGRLKQFLDDNMHSCESIRDNLQKVLQQEGINYSRKDYDTLMCTLRYTSTGQANIDDLTYTVYEETPQDLDDRMDRRCRSIPPEPNLQIYASQPSHKERPNSQLNLREGLRKLDDYFITDSFGKTFKNLDQDRDGYMSMKDFQQAISAKKLLTKQEMECVKNYLDSQNKGFLRFHEVHQKLKANVISDLNKTNLPTLLMPRLRSGEKWLTTKRNFVESANKYQHNVPTKYSAWPKYLGVSDLSLMQPNDKSAMHAGQHQRFNAKQKESYAQQDKIRTKSIQQSRIQRRQAWDNLFLNRIQSGREDELKKQQQVNQLKRLAQEIYERNCHKQY